MSYLEFGIQASADVIHEKIATYAGQRQYWPQQISSWLCYHGFGKPFIIQERVINNDLWYDFAS